MKPLIISMLFATQLTACGLFGARVESPCAGLYCLSVTEAQIPGEALICYKTAAERSAAQVKLQSEGKSVKVVGQ